MTPPKLTIHPPLLNTACPWATTDSHLAALLACPSTGAITTRTSLLEGFAHDDAIHQHRFVNPSTHLPLDSEPPSAVNAITSLNSYGYSPYNLAHYLATLQTLPPSPKPIIISVTGSPKAIAACYAAILLASPKIPHPLAMEVNLSCPNIPDAPPPAYDPSFLAQYLDQLPTPEIPIGIKVPPFTYSDQFTSFISTLARFASKISFLTAVNTLGNCTLGNDQAGLPCGDGLGGLAGVSLHPLALGNVVTLRKLLDEREPLAHIAIIGVGGVQGGDGYRRMRRAGAMAVGVATGLGALGVGVFERIAKDIKEGW